MAFSEYMNFTFLRMSKFEDRCKRISLRLSGLIHGFQKMNSTLFENINIRVSQKFGIKVY